MKNEKAVIDNVKVWSAIEISYSGNLATRELIDIFSPVAEEKGLEHAGYAFQLYFVKTGLWPTKTLKSGKVQPIGWQKSLLVGKGILEREPSNTRGVEIVKITTVYNNMLSMIAADKAAIKKAKVEETEETEETDTNSQKVSAENFLVSINNEMKELVILLDRAKSSPKIRKAELMELIEYTSQVISSIFETEEA